MLEKNMRLWFEGDGFSVEVNYKQCLYKCGWKERHGDRISGLDVAGAYKRRGENCKWKLCVDLFGQVG